MADTTPKTGISAIWSGDNTLGHTTAVAAFASAQAGIIEYVLAWAHAPSPASIDKPLVVVLAFITSWAMQRLGG